VTSTQERSGSSSATSGGIDWVAPVPGGQNFATIDQAAPALSFRPLTAPELGAPNAVIVSPPQVPREHRFVVLRFEHPSWGTFLVQQQPLERDPAQAQASLEALAGPCAAEGCAGTWTLAVLKDGRRALVVTGPGSEDQQTNFLTFIDEKRRLRIDLEGPPPDFTGEEAIDVANALVRAGS